MLTWMVVCVAVGFAQPADVPAERALSTPQFAHAFIETQPVQVAVAAGDAQPVLLRDSDGTEVARREATGDAGVLDFGRLPPGYYEAVAGQTVLPLVVLIDPAKRVGGGSRLATDNAMSWLVEASQWEPVARLLQQCGIRCVRERLLWGEVEPERGRYDWGHYDRTATILHEHGIEVYQIFHSVPAWSRSDEDSAAAPDDLRDVYRFAQSLATQFRGRVQAWEAWNEPDIFFFSHPSSECAALQKAAFLGFRSVDPAQLVLGPSMAHGAGTFSEGLLENGVGQYLDIWNYHMYADPSAYAGRRAGFQAQLARYDVVVPDWMTEAGAPLKGPEGVLPREARIAQAQFLSRAFPQALAAGLDRHFWFVFPFLREGTAGWGLFEPQLRAPYPGLAALAAATYALGRGDCLGTLALADEAGRAIAFARGDDSAAVAVWRESDAPADIALPFHWNDVREARSHLGTPLPTGQGPATVRVARGAVYLILPQAALQGKLTPPAQTPIPPRTDDLKRAIESAPLHSLVVRLRVPEGTPDKTRDAYRVPAGTALTLQAEAYNFGSHAFEGHLQMSAPEGWRLEPAQASVSVPPGQRAAVPVRLTVAQQKDPAPLWLVAHSADAQSTPAMVRVCADLNTLTARERLPLNMDDPTRWQQNIAGHGTMEITACDEGGVRLHFNFSTDGDNWAYPRVYFTPELDLSNYDAVRFEYRTDTTDPGPVRLFLFESQGAGYISKTELPGDTHWRRATILLSELDHVAQTSPDPNGQLDTQRVAAVSVGANTKPRSLVLEVRNIEALRF